MAATKKTTKNTAAKAKTASKAAAVLDTATKNRILNECARELLAQSTHLIKENAKDLAYAKRESLPSAMIDRLRLTEPRIKAMAASIRTVAKLKNPVGENIENWKRPNGLKIKKVRVPLGVILIIYEARPNVTQECASLCLKSGNSVILKGGKEAYYSNLAIASIFRKVLKRNNLPQEIVSFVATTDRQLVDELLGLTEDIHLVIPRGGIGLIRKVAKISRIPVVKHFRGNCQIYVDRKADLKKALAIVVNAKCQRPSVCNAAETLLVHKSVAAKFLPALGKELTRLGCEIRGDKVVRKYIKEAKAAKTSDWYDEFLDLILAVRVVSTLDEAIKHVQDYSSGHTEAIITEDRQAASRFVNEVDSSSIMVNATTRFADGFEYGFGAEIGISTDKIHARGPMGIEGLTSYKYVVEGNGQIRT